MWRSGGGCRLYLYDQNESLTWGAGSATNEGVFTAGQWHNVVFQVSLNNPGMSDGFSRIFVDGQEILTEEGVEFRGTGGEHTKIQKFLFSTFHGGSNPAWAPVDAAGNFTTVYSYFDNIVITEGIHSADELAELAAKTEALEVALKE